MKFTEIKIPITDFSIDVIIGGTKKEFSLFQQKRYGLSVEDCDKSDHNEVSTIYSASDSVLKGETRFYLKLAKMPKENIPVFIHELWHLMWHISDTIKDLKLNKDTQQWSACMIEKISQLVLNAKFEKI